MKSVVPTKFASKTVIVMAAALLTLEAVLNRLDNLFKLRTNCNRNSETSWTDKVVEDPKAGIDG
jgi:hypothetical protein